MAAALSAEPSSTAAPPVVASVSASPQPSASVAPTRPAVPLRDVYPSEFAQARANMLERMRVMLQLEPEAIERVQAILSRSKVIGQGNPEISEYAMTRSECEERRSKAQVSDPDDPRCGAPFMVALTGPKASENAEPVSCIDRFEFPNVPCDYPVTWASAREAHELCQAVGKRLCDAHEWEGACAGAVLPPEQDYVFGKPRKQGKSMHNTAREIVWAYGPDKDHKKCATNSKKSEKCTASGGFKRCGSNTYPAGSFPECRSSFGVYDQHGNAAEHMNLPLRAEEFARDGKLGETEMKGSWFIFQKYEAHEDDCRWRAPDWHVTKVMNPKSHQNYHLGFRCCKDPLK